MPIKNDAKKKSSPSIVVALYKLTILNYYYFDQQPQNCKLSCKVFIHFSNTCCFDKLSVSISTQS